MIERSYNRKPEDKRPVKFTRNFTKFTPGSVLVEVGETKVIVTASIDEKVPRFLSDSGSGWITAEYSMLPGATLERSMRERNKVSGRTMEIQRLIGRSLRAALDLTAMKDITITIDCDVIQADGGTRTASISGAYVALYDALRHLQSSGKIATIPIKEPMAAISVGICKGYELLDLDYSEDSAADVDANVVMTESGKVVEFQCTSEGNPIELITMMSLVQLGQKGVNEIIELQKQALGT